MFGMDKVKEANEEPENAPENTGAVKADVAGFMAEAFMGRNFSGDMNKSVEATNEAVEMQKRFQNPDANSLPATAEVISVQDTGRLVNFNPVVILQLRVTPQSGPPFDVTAKTIVPKSAVPGAGDAISIRYAPTDATKISIV